MAFIGNKKNTRQTDAGGGGNESRPRSASQREVEERQRRLRERMEALRLKKQMEAREMAAPAIIADIVDEYYSKNERFGVQRPSTDYESSIRFNKTGAVNPSSIMSRWSTGDAPGTSIDQAVELSGGQWYMPGLFRTKAEYDAYRRWDIDETAKETETTRQRGVSGIKDYSGITNRTEQLAAQIRDEPDAKRRAALQSDLDWTREYAARNFAGGSRSAVIEMDSKAGAQQRTLDILKRRMRDIDEEYLQAQRGVTLDPAAVGETNEGFDASLDGITDPFVRQKILEARGQYNEDPYKYSGEEMNSSAQGLKFDQYEAQIRALEGKIGTTQDSLQKITGTEGKTDRYYLEMNAQNGYTEIPRRADFAKNSKPVAGQDIQLEVSTYSAGDMGAIQRNTEKIPFSEVTQNYMTPEELSVAYYLRNTQGNDAAAKYIQEYLKSNIAQRESEAMAASAQTEAANAGGLEAVGGTLGAAFANRYLGAVGMADVSVDRFGNWLAERGIGEFKPVDTYNPASNSANAANEYKGTISGRIDENAGGVASFLYDAGVGIVESAAGMVAGPVGAGVTGGLSAGNSSYREALARGLNEDEAYATAGAAAIFESLFEYVSVEKLFSMSSPKSALAALKNVFKQGAFEASEEVATTLANTAYDNLVNGGMSEINQRIAELQAGGMDYNAARKMANSEWGQQLALDAAGGLISGGVFAAGNQTGQYLGNRNDARTPNSDATNKIIDGMPPAGLEAPVQPSGANTGKPSPGTPNAPKEAADARKDAYKAGKSGNTTITGADGTVETVTPKGIVAVGQNAASVMISVEKADGMIVQVPVSGIEFSSDAEAQLYNYASGMPTPAMAEYYRETVTDGQVLEDVAVGMQNAYDKANEGGWKLETVQNSVLSQGLTDEQIKASFLEGMKDRGARVKAEQAAAEARQAKETDARGVVEWGDVSRKALAPEQRTQVDLASIIVSATSRVKLQVFQSKANADETFTTANGYYNTRTGTIGVDVNAGRNKASEPLAYTTFVSTLSHELTHKAQTETPELYEEYRSLVLEYMQEQGMNLDEMIDTVMANDKSVKLREDALDEIVANASSTMLRDSDYVDNLLTARGKEVRTIGQKVLAFVRRVKAAIQKAVAGNPNVRREAEILLRDIDKFSKKWSDMMIQATGVANRPRTETKPAQMPVEAATKAVEAPAPQSSIFDDISESNDAQPAESTVVVNEDGTVGVHNEPPMPENHHIDNRTWDSVADKAMTPFVNDYKMSRVYMGAAAQAMLYDLDSTSKGERYQVGETREWSGVKRQTTDQIAYLLDNAKMSYMQIRNALNKLAGAYTAGDLTADITNSVGLRRVEFALDHMLSEGYTTLEGVSIAPDLDYIEYKRSLPGAKLGVAVPSGAVAGSFADYVGAEVRNSARDTTETPEFKRWFKNSTVVDDEGKPKVMYHGSTAQFTQFDKSKAKGSGLYGRGFYFADSEGAAGTYGKTLSVYLSIQNPLSPGGSTVGRAQVRKFLNAVAQNENYSIENYGTYDVSKVLGLVYDSDAFKVIQDVSATAIGDMVEAVQLFNSVNGTSYDGIVVPTETVVFAPTQIKSATDNTGAFGADNPDIRHSAREADDYSQKFLNLRGERDGLRQAIDTALKSDEFQRAVDALSANLASGSDAEREAIKAYRQASEPIAKMQTRLNQIEAEMEKLDEQAAGTREDQESAKIAKSGKPPEEYYRAKAVKEFGLTANFNYAGYILPNGKMLNFGGQGNVRGQDHRAIGTIYPNGGHTEALIRFMNEGSIRIMAESPGVDVSTSSEPTRAQYATIRAFVESHGGKEFYVDLSGKDGKSAGSYEYEGRISPSRVVADIQYFFENGETRPQTDVSRFRYSARDAAYLSAVESGDMDAAQEMVDEAANAAGYTIKAYHGTSKQFSIFGAKGSKTDVASARLGFWLSDSTSTARAYSTPQETDYESKETWDDISKRADEIMKKYYDKIVLDDVPWKQKSFMYSEGYWNLDALEDFATKYMPDEYRDMKTRGIFGGEKYVPLSRENLKENLRRWDDIRGRQSLLLEWVNDNMAYGRIHPSNLAEYLRQVMDQAAVRAASQEADMLGVAPRILSVYAKIGKLTKAQWPYQADEQKTEKIKRAMYNGRDGVLFAGIIDGGNKSNHYVVFDHRNIKSADPVTYSDSGSVIPLSERFNAENEDIRYSVRDSGEVDSEGNALTVGQVEYFKDSTVRDEDGRLLVVYHGSDETFNVFDRTKSRANMDIQGNFFSPWDDDARGYGRNVRAFYLNITNPADSSIGYKALNRHKGQNEAGIKAREYLTQMGYDGVNNDGEEYIAFTPDQIKSIDNKTPSVSPDIRYSARDMTQISDREILATAFETVAQNENERGMLADYRKRLKEYDALQADWDAKRARIKELSFGKYERTPETRAELVKVKNQANVLAKRVSDFDKRLLKFEAAAPLRAVVETQRKTLDAFYKGKITEAKLKERMSSGAEIARVKRTYDERIKAIREQRDAKVEATKQAGRERIENLREGRKETEIRAKIKKVVDDLNDRLLKPREGRYVPKDFVSMVVEIGEMVQTRTKQPAGQKAKDKLAAISKAYEKLKGDRNFGMMYNDAVRDVIDQVAELAGDKTIYQLELGELTALYNALKAARKMITDAAKVYGDKRKRDAFQLGLQGLEELRASRGKFKWNSAEKFFSSQLSARSMFLRFGNHSEGGAWDTSYRILNEGEHNVVRIMMDANAIFNDVVNGKENQARIAQLQSTDAKDLIDVGLKNDNGEAVMITRGMMLELYTHLQNEQNVRHIMYGGMKAPDLKMYYDGKAEAWGSRNVRIAGFGARFAELEYALSKATTDAERANIQSEYNDTKAAGDVYIAALRATIERQLSAYDKKLLAAMDYFYNTFSKETLNEATETLFGFSKATVEKYFPIRTDKNFRTAQFESIARDFALANAGIMKTRVNSSNPILLGDIIETTQVHMKQMSQYAGLLVPLSDFQKVYSTTLPGYRDSLQNALVSSFDVNATKWVENFLADMNGARRRESTIFDRVKGKYAKAILTLNISSALKQVTAYPTAASVVGWSPTLKALARVGKADRALIDKYSTVLYSASRGLTSVELGDVRENMKWGAKFNKAIDFLQKLDVATRGRMWDAARFYVDANFSGLAKGTQAEIDAGESAYYQKVAEVFDKIVEDTQQSYSATQLPDILRSPNALIRSMTMFMSQPLKNLGVVYDASANLRAKALSVKANDTAETRAELSAARGQFANTISAQVTALIFEKVMSIAAMALLYKVNPLRDDDDELTWEAVLRWFGWETFESVLGSFTFGSELASAIQSGIEGKQPYDIDVGGVASINDFLQNVSRAWNEIKKMNSGEYEWPANLTDAVTKWGNGSLAKVATSLGTLTGVPVGNVLNILKAGYFHAVDAANGELGKFSSGIETANKTYYKKLYESALGGDRKAFDTELEGLRADRELDPGTILGGVKTQTGDQFKDGKITEEQARAILREYVRESKDETDKSIATWKYEIDTGRTIGKLKDDYLNGTVTFDEAVSMRKQYALNEEADAKTAVNKWRYEKETGMPYDELEYAFVEGELSETEIRGVLMEYGGLDAKDSAIKTNGWEYKEKTGNDDFSMYSYAKDIVNAGGSVSAFNTAVKDVVSEKAYDVDESDAHSAVKTYIGTLVKDQAITPDKALALRTKYLGEEFSDNEKYFEVRKYKYMQKNGTSEGYSKYADFLGSMKTGGDSMKKYADELLSHGVKKGSIASSISSKYKEQYFTLKETNPAAAAEMLEWILDAYVAIGYSRSRQRSYIAKNWKPEEDDDED